MSLYCLIDQMHRNKLNPLTVRSLDICSVGLNCVFWCLCLIKTLCLAHFFLLKYYVRSFILVKLAAAYVIYITFQTACTFPSVNVFFSVC